MKYFNETYIKRKFMTRNEWSDTYRAIHATTEEKVLLKVLVRKSNEEEYINNLLKEVEVVKNIRNPYLTNVNNMFKYSGCGKTYYYIEGEYFKGISLEEKLLLGKFEERESLKIVENVAKGLEEFHNRNILFDNLNLENIYINGNNAIKADVLSHLENKDFVILSKEDEVEVKEERFNPRKDIHDLGVILYCLLTGKLVFEPNNYKKEIFNKEIVTIIEKATDNSIEDKYRSINRFILDIKSYLDNGVLSEETYDLEVVNMDKKKRKKGKLGKILGVCATLVIVGGAGIYGYDFLEKNKKDAQINSTNIEENIIPEEEQKVQEDVEEKVTEEEKTSTSNNIKDESSESKNSTNNTKKENTSTSNSNSTSSSNNNSSNNNSSSSSSNSNSSNNNSSSNNSSNNSSSNDNNSNNSSSDNNSSNKPSKPNNNGSSQETTKPDDGDGAESETPEITPPSENTEVENPKPESSDTDVESE